MTLYPVILPVKRPEGTLTGREKVERLSAVSREALAISLRKSGLTLSELAKDGNDVPLPSDGSYWSVSHKPGCVAAVVSREPVGIDVEEIRPRSEGIFWLTASEGEYELAGGLSWNTFFRVWTAKEAVLKSTGKGIGGLSSCRVCSVPDEDHIDLAYMRKLFRVAQVCHGGYIASVVQDNNEIEWTLVEILTEE
ncbi:MAG: 4'-phosphopantetheinyl transferase superfamily protein [Dehalococcoidia bacterium]|nr:4'-phosphopantetheinyl transferase superfamily protein [Dehalococcoidia bacterium]